MPPQYLCLLLSLLLLASGCTQQPLGEEISDETALAAEAIDLGTEALDQEFGVTSSPGGAFPGSTSPGAPDLASASLGTDPLGATLGFPDQESGAGLGGEDRSLGGDQHPDEFVGPPSPVRRNDPDEFVGPPAPVRRKDPDEFVGPPAPVRSNDPDEFVGPPAPVRRNDPDEFVGPPAPVRSNDPDEFVGPPAPVRSKDPDEFVGPPAPVRTNDEPAPESDYARRFREDPASLIPDDPPLPEGPPVYPLGRGGSTVGRAQTTGIYRDVDASVHQAHSEGLFERYSTPGKYLARAQELYPGDEDRQTAFVVKGLLQKHDGDVEAMGSEIHLARYDGDGGKWKHNNVMRAAEHFGFTASTAAGGGSLPLDNPVGDRALQAATSLYTAASGVKQMWKRKGLLTEKDRSSLGLEQRWGLQGTEYGARARRSAAKK